MKTVRIDRRRHCELIDKPLPSIRGNYVLIKVCVAPMCNEYLAYRDLTFLERNRADSLGHELAGEVVDAPPGGRVKPLDRVVALCGFPCGSCDLCRAGHYSHCAQPEDPLDVCQSASGECGFAQYAIKPDWLLVPIPDDVSFEHASMACCGLGPTFGAMERMALQAFDTVLITGLGPVGLGGVINAKFRGATVIGVDRSPYRRKLAESLGCDFVVDPSTPDAHQRVLELTGGRGVDGAIDCSGHAPYQRLAIDGAARLGSVAFLAEPGELSLRVNEDLIQKGVTIFGSLDINQFDAGRLMAMIRRVPDKVDALITHRYPLRLVGEAFERQIERNCGKIVLHPWDGD